MSGRLAGALVALLCLAGCSAGPPQPTPSSLVIAVEVPENGPQAADGAAVVDAVNQVLREEFGGRLEGLRLTVRVYDDSAAGRRDTSQGQLNLRRMAADRSVLGLIGPLNSDLAAAEIPIANAAHLAMVSPAASNPCLTKALAECLVSPRELRRRGPNDFFRVLPTDDLEPAALVAFAAHALHVTRIALGSDGQAYGTVLQVALEALLKQAGLTVVATASLDPTSPAAVDAFVAEAKSGEADAVFFAGRGDGGACRVRPRVVAKLGKSVPFLGGSGLQGSACLHDAGDAAAGLYSVAAGPGSLTEQARAAARVLLKAVLAAVKAAGGNLPSREEVRLAVSHSLSPRFDAAGDTRDRLFTILQARSQPGDWVAETQVSV